jgi:hypothetical protein
MIGSDHRVVVYRYGTPSWVQLPDEVDEQLRLAHQLRNHLVQLREIYDADVAGLWSSRAQIAVIEQHIAGLKQQESDLARAVAAERSAARRRGATASSPALAQVRAQIRAARGDRRALTAAAYAAELTDDIAALGLRYKQAIKDAYAQYCQQDGLYWATYNLIVRQHRVAVARVSDRRRQGLSAQLRYRRWSGRGTLATQLQRPAGAPVRSPATIAAADSRWRNVLQVPWTPPQQFQALSWAQRRRAGRGVLRWAVGQGRTVELPIQVHRMMPEDAEITGAQLVVTRRGDRRRVEVHVTAMVPAPAVVTDGPAVAVHLGWRRDSCGVRVATWRSTTPLPPPPTDLAEVVQMHTEVSGAILLPQRLLDRTDGHDRLRGRRDRARDRIRARVVDWLGQHPQADDALAAHHVQQWIAPARFAALARRWADQPPVGEGAAEVVAELLQWQQHDRPRWQREAHGRVKVLDSRDDAYRKVAAWLGHAGHLILDDTDLSRLATRHDAHLPAALTQAAARHRTLAAPGRLRQMIRTAAQAHGTPEQVIDHTGTTRTHYQCGHLNPADDRYARGRIVPCDGCGQGYDQDESATLLLLAASGNLPPAGSSTR